MATDNELNNERQMNSQREQGNRFEQDAIKVAAQRAEFARSLTEELKDQLNIRSRNNETDRATLSLARELQSSVAQNVAELGNSGQVQRQINKDKKLTLNLERELASISNNLSEEQINNAVLLGEIIQDERDTRLELEDIQRRLASGEEDLNYELQNRSVELENILESRAQERVELESILETEGGIARKEMDRAAVLSLMIRNNQENVAAKEEELNIQRQINSQMGVTGALVTGVGGLMERLGMRSGIFNDAMAEAKETMHSMAEETIRTGKGFSKLQIAAAGIGKVLKGFSKALFDPAVLAGKIADAFFNVDKALVDVRRQTGLTSSNFASLNSQLASTTQILELVADFTKETGLAATSIFSNEDLGRLGEAKNLMGLTSQEAGKLGLLSKIAGENIEDFDKSVYKGVDAMNQLNGSIVSPHQVLKDVLSTSDGIALSLGGSSTAISKAATAARGLGLDLQKVNDIAEGMMDFESSIQAELEAQLLTGNNINLSKARELALNNDLAGLATELTKQGASAAQFSEMNRIQQQALAKSLGMSRDELAKSLIAQDTQNSLTDEQKAKMRGVTAEQSRSMDIQSKLNLLVDKLAQSFAPVLEVLYPIVDAIASIATPIAKGIAQVMELSKSFGKLGPLIVTGLGYAIIKSISSLGLMKKAFGGVLKSAKSLLGIGGQLNNSPLINPPAPIGPQQAPGGGIAGSISKINTKALIKGAAAMAIAAAGIYIFAKAVQELEKVEDWTNVAIGLGAFGISMGIIGTIGKFASSGLTALAAGLTTFGTAMIGPGGLGLAALTIAAVGMGAALNLAAPAIEAFSSVIKVAFNGIGEVLTIASNGIVSILNAITPTGILSLAALGPALISAGTGLVAFSASSVLAGKGISTLQTLSEMTGPLTNLGNSLTSVATGIAGIAAALSTLETEKLEELKSLVVTTAFAAPMVAATGAITDLISGMSGTPKESETNSQLVAKIDELINVVKQGGDVYMDGNKVGQSLVLSSTRTS